MMKMLSLTISISILLVELAYTNINQLILIHM